MAKQLKCERSHLSLYKWPPRIKESSFWPQWMESSRQKFCSKSGRIQDSASLTDRHKPAPLYAHRNCSLEDQEKPLNICNTAHYSLSNWSPQLWGENADTGLNSHQMTPQTNIKKPNNPQQFQLHQNIYKPFSATGEIRAKEQVFFFFFLYILG